MFQIALADQNFFLVVRSFRDDPSKRIAEKRSAPEFQAFALGAIAANVTELVAHAVYYADKNSVGDGVGTLDGTPRVMLHCAEFGFLVRMPADCRRIEKNICALQSGKARAFRIPLVPADESAHAAIFRVEGLKTEIPRSEVKLFVIERVVG